MDAIEKQPLPFDARTLEGARKRKRSRSSARAADSVKRQDLDKDRDQDRDEQPQPYDAKALHAARQKRPGARARISEAELDAVRQRQAERDRDVAAAEAADVVEQTRVRGINDVVRQHYNNVPERGREWRKTESKIRGLRSFNNWVKSCIIQRFSPEEDSSSGRDPSDSRAKPLLVLDIGCGKGGDLGKWQSAPQPVELYVGLDPAEVSVEQARERYRSMTRTRGPRGFQRQPPASRLFESRFLVKDCFGQSLEDVEIVQQVGFEQPAASRRGFDIVSVMFAMHYAFESEQKARRMLRNVAGALKKGGRFIGCIPNSDVIGERVRAFNQKSQPVPAEAGEASDPALAAAAADSELEEGEAEATAEWGNAIYRVRFPGATPADGVFRPAFGWRYNFFLDEAVEGVPEYVVPWEAFRALAEDYNLEMQYHKPFLDIWDAECNDLVLGPLSERMGVRARDDGRLMVSPDEREAASFYVGFCFYKV